MMNTVWQEVRNQMKTELPEKSYSLWIEPITLLEDKNNTLTLGCPNRFFRDWVLEHYMGILADKLYRIADGTFKLDLKVEAPQKTKPTPQLLDEPKQMTLPIMPAKPVRGGWLKNEFTFDRFVVGECNDFAYSASKALASAKNCHYDFLFINATTGLGKSHLSQAVGNAVLDQNPEVRVCYTTVENFIYELVCALKNSSIGKFKERYRRECDVLLLEDVHFLSGKEKIQLELGHTLDILASHHKKVIFTSSLLPKDIPNLKKELSSRFSSGIITNLNKPDFQTRLKIVKKKSAEQGVCLPEDIVELLAKHLVRDVRQIEGAIKCIKAKSELMKERITPQLTRGVLKCLASEPTAVSMEEVKKLVCQYFKVDPSALNSKSRKKMLSYPRNIYVYLCRHYTDETLDKIGRSIGRKHSTIVYASETVEKKMKTDPNIKNQVNFLVQKLKDAAN
jgi:chromosomal replication initiator protein